jgi:phospholipid/cholesterol/gamma-HCH transport system ATP-binding protein
MRQRITSLKVQDLTVGFENHLEILKNVNFEFPLGKTVFLDGPQGSGKSLLLRILAGLVEPLAGDVLINSMSTRDMSFEELVPFRLSTSFCFEDGGLLMNKSCLENLKLPLMYHHQWRAERSEDMLRHLAACFDVTRFLDLRPAMVSASVRKTFGIMRSLLSNPQILFLDEPSLGLSEEGQKALKVSLTKYREGSKGDELLIIASSDKAFVEQFEGDHLLIENQNLKWIKKVTSSAS